MANDVPQPIYLDHHATTPCAPEVVDAMLPWLRGRPANASSTSHAAGRAARDAVEEARADVAALVGASPREIVFTSGATEALNLAIFGCAPAGPTGAGGAEPAKANGRDAQAVTAATEHAAVLAPFARLRSRGVDTAVLRVGADGLLDPQVLVEALGPRTRLVSIMAANNEVGVIQPLGELVEVTRAHAPNAAFLTDAVQAVACTAFDASALGVDLVALSAHKIYGPQGAGALVIRQPGRRTGRRPVRVRPRSFGGGQERGLRPGTLPVASLVGFGAAARLALARRGEDARRLASQRDALLARLRGGLGEAGMLVHGSLERRLPHNLSVAFPGVEARALMTRLERVQLSAGSACQSSGGAPSHVLTSMGVSTGVAFATVRIGLGRTTTDADVRDAADELVRVVRELRAARQGA